MVGPFSVVGAGARIQVGKERGGGREDAEEGSPRGELHRVCLRRGPTSLYRRRVQRGGAFLFPGDIYLGAGGRRGPRFA